MGSHYNPSFPLQLRGGLVDLCSSGLRHLWLGARKLNKHAKSGSLYFWQTFHIWVVVKIMVPFWIPIIIRHLIFRVPQKGTIILTTTHLLIAEIQAGSCSTTSIPTGGGCETWSPALLPDESHVTGPKQLMVPHERPSQF